MGKKIWKILKRVLLGAAAWFATLTALVILWISICPGRKTYSDWYALIMFFLPLGVALKVALRGLKIQIARKAPKTQSASAPIPEPAKPEPPKPEPPKPEPPKPEPQKQEPQKQEPPKQPAPAKSDENIFPVAGVSFREDAIIKLARKNSNYSLSKSDIIDMGMTDKEIFRYRWGTRPAELVPEPDNPHDSNAVKVMVDGVHIGYIKAVSCEHVLQLLKDDRIRRVTCEIGGGPYKEVSEDFDYKTLDSTYSLDRGENPIWAKVKITEKKG